MSITLRLTAANARAQYRCLGCGREIRKGVHYFRHDPYPQARSFRGQPTTHWCRECILASLPEGVPRGSFLVPALHVLGRPLSEREHADLALRPIRVELISVGEALAARLADEPRLLHALTPEQFEQFVCERLFSMGFEPKQVGSTNRKDGGVDILFWPRARGAFPFLGAAQVKHHRNPAESESVRTVRDFSGVMAGQPFAAGLIVTNTSFSPDAQWFARQHARLVRLRGFEDIRRWLLGNFGDEEEWREIPSSLELCPGVVVKIR
jgi:hypothetical protein